MAGVSTALESLDDLACTQWEVEYSRFFHFPRQSISSSSPALPEGLRPLPKGKIRSRGTWLTASSTAILLLRTDSTYPIPVLSVILSRAILVASLPRLLCLVILYSFFA